MIGAAERRVMGALLALWDELRARGEPIHAEMRGASMWPAAPEGSVLAVTPCPSTELHPGDLVVFRLGAAVITHRVIGVDEGGRVRAWGDALLRPDPPIAPGDVLGRARVVRRGSMILPAPSRARASLRTGFVAAQRLGAAALRLADARRRDRASADAA